MKRLILAAMLALGAAGAAHAHDPLKAAIEGAHRTPANVARDAARHPYETLTFFGVKPDMTVVELSPSGGWYTEILAPYLREKGKLIGAAEEMKPENRYAMAFKKKIDSNAAVYDKVAVGLFEPGKQYNIAPAGSVDMVLTFRNIHGWMGDDAADAMFKAMYAALKPGGILGVTEHRAKSDKPQDPKAESGYVREDYAIALIEKAGFKLIGKSEINANPKDTADHPNGVWSLPPTLQGGDVDRDKFLAIGESDRFTLRFRKPE
jgi:predicted methyltransferase